MARILLVCLSLIGLCLILAGVSTFSNRNLPEEDRSDSLNPVDQARALEALHLKTVLGDRLWPGWGSADIPVILWNRSYEFLLDYRGTLPSGWSAAIDVLDGRPYYRRTADDPQNFAVRVDNTWVASMATKLTTDQFLIDTFRDNFPTPIKQIFPYRFLSQPSETQMGGLLHETFHVYQYQNAPSRIAEAESIHKLGNEYKTFSDSFKPEWKKESALLADALEAGTQSEKMELVRQFLETRDVRRQDSGLDNRLIDYERWLEWEEGTAKYIEVAILRQAGETNGYQVLPEMVNDTNFKQYQKMDQRWSQELIQLRYQTTSGETQLYMTGMAQAFLLDDLKPGWKDRYWEEGVFLEDLLRQAITGD